MPEAGFLQQKRGSPTGLALVVLLHAAVLSALVLIKGPEFVRQVYGRTVVDTIPVPPEPAPEPPPDRRSETPQQPTTVTQTTTSLPTINQTIFDNRPSDPPVIEAIPAERVVIASRPEIPPVRRDAEIISRDLQPPYPTDMERLQRDGTVRLRVTIGANGRVTAVERISATSDSFWRVTERQALNRWRFRPATVDGRPTESTKVMTVTFRIEDQG